MRDVDLNFRKTWNNSFHEMTDCDVLFEHDLSLLAIMNSIISKIIYRDLRESTLCLPLFGKRRLLSSMKLKLIYAL